MARKIKEAVLPALALVGIGVFLIYAPANPLITEAPQTELPQPGRLAAADCLPRKESKLHAAALERLALAMADKGPIRVLVTGPSAYPEDPFSDEQSYPDRLQAYLGKLFKGQEVELISRNIAGEVADEASLRLQLEIADTEPDLVVWQVGAADALARVDTDSFEQAVGAALDEIKSHGIDVVLVDPRYLPELAGDGSYRRIVAAIARVAKDHDVPLVHRYEMMRSQSAEEPAAGPQTPAGPPTYSSAGFDNDCMAEKVAEAIAVGQRRANATPPRPENRQ